MLLAKIYLLTFLTVTFSILQSDTIGVLQTTQQKSFDISTFTDGDVINIHFAITNSFNSSSTFIITSFQKFYGQNQISQTTYYGQRPQDHSNIDLDAMWSYQQQYINLVKLVGKNNLYVTVFNFDTNIRNIAIDYQINVTSSGDNICGPCLNNQAVNNDCFCQNCRGSYFGKRCQRKKTTITQTDTYRLQAKQLTYYEIQNEGYYRIYIQISQGLGQAYFQFIDFNNQVASFYNVVYSDVGSSAVYTLSSGRRTQITATINDRPLGISIISFNSDNVDLTIQIDVSENTNILVIILGILGAILFIGLIVAAICVVRKNGQARVSIQGDQIPSSTKLSGDQIQRYFPAAYLRQIVGSADQSTMQNFQKKRSEDSDCVICLQKIQLQDVVRMGYCKHIFHSTCLINWLKKQRNCPYCRRNFDRDTTGGDYERLMSLNNKRVLRNLDLLQAIYKSPPAVSAEQ